MKTLRFAKLSKSTANARQQARRIRTLSFETMEGRDLLTAIDTFYAAQKADLGKPIGTEQTYSNGSGAYRDFQFGSVYFSTKYNMTREVLGASNTKFKNMGGPQKIGFPITNTVLAYTGVTKADFVYRTRFSSPVTGDATIVDSRFGTYEVDGPVLAAYLGPSLDPRALVPVENSAHGKQGSGYVDVQVVDQPSSLGPARLYSRPGADNFIVPGSIRTKWIQLGFENYGYPITQSYAVGDAGAVNMDFHSLKSNSTATIGQSPNVSKDAHETHGKIRQAWANSGGNKVEVPVYDDTTSGSTTFNTFQNVTTRWQTRWYYDGDDEPQWEISGRGENIGTVQQANTAPGEPVPVNTNVKLVRHYEDDPVHNRSVATNYSDMYITGGDMAIDSSNSQKFKVTVDGVTSVYDLTSVKSISIVGNKAGSTLSISDLSRTTPFLNYGIEANRVLINSLALNYGTSIKALTFVPSGRVSGSVNVRGTSAFTSVVVQAPSSMSYNVNVAFRDTDKALYSNVNVVGNARTNITATDYVSANPDISLNGTTISERGVSGKVTFNTAVGQAVLSGAEQSAILRVLGKTVVPAKLVGGAGATHFVVGSDSTGLDAVQGYVIVDSGPSGQDVLTVTDVHAKATGRLKNYSLVGGFAATDDSPELDSSMTLPNNANIYYDTLQTVELLTADQARAMVRFNASSSTPATEVNIQAGSKATTIASEFGGFGGTLNVVGAGAATTLSLNETDLYEHTYNLDAGVVDQDGTGVVRYTGVGTLSLEGGHQHNNFKVIGNSAETVTDIYAGTSQNNFFVTTDGGNNVLGTVRLHGAGVSGDFVSDVTFTSLNAGDAETFWFLQNLMQSSGGQNIEFDGMSEVFFDPTNSGQATTVNVWGTAAEANLFIGAKAGDTINFGYPASDAGGTLSSILGTVVVVAPGGSPYVNLDVGNDVDLHAVDSQFTDWGVSLSGAAPADLYFFGVSRGTLSVNDPNGILEGMDTFFENLEATGW